MEPTNRTDFRPTPGTVDELDAALARETTEAGAAADRLRRLADSLAPCLADGRCAPGFERTEDARAFAELGREVKSDELREYFVRRRGLPPAAAEANVRAAEEATARGAEIALREELVDRLREARELLPRLAADPEARARLVARLLEIPDGPGRRAAIRDLGLAADPAGFAAALREHQACLLLREQLARDPAGFLADAQARLGDPARAAALDGEARAALAAWEPFAFPPEASAAPAPAAAPLREQAWPWEDAGGQALQQALDAQPMLRTLVSSILRDDSLRRIDREICERATELAGAVDAALSLVLLGERADSPLVLLRDCEPALAALLGDVGEDSVLARGVERRIAEREDEYAAWATVEWAVRLGTRFALSFGSFGLLGGALGIGAGIATEAGEAAWAGEVLRGLAGVGALDYGRLATLRTAGEAAGDAAREAAWDLLFNLAGLRGVGVLLEPGAPRNPLGPPAR